MKAELFSDELCPFFTINEAGRISEGMVDIPLDVLHWIDSTMKDFYAVQKYLEELASSL